MKINSELKYKIHHETYKPIDNMLVTNNPIMYMIVTNNLYRFVRAYIPLFQYDIK